MFGRSLGVDLRCGLPLIATLACGAALAWLAQKRRQRRRWWHFSSYREKEFARDALPSAAAPLDQDLVADVVELIAKHPFVSVLSVDPTFLSCSVSQVPCVVLPSLDDGSLSLFVHLARDNPQARSFVSGTAAAATVMVHGPHALVRSSDYATQPQVGTWNFITAYLDVAVEVLAEGRQHLEALAQHFEHGSFRWSPYAQSLLGDIVPLRLRVVGIRSTFKLSQNKSPENRQAVIAVLQQQNESELVGWMQRCS